MSIINNGLLLAAEAAAAPPVTGISRSLRFNSADSAFLNRTPASAGNRKTWTWAGWVKRSSLGANQALFSVPQGGGYPNTGIIFNSSDQLRFFAADANATIFAERITTAVYRDTSAWMHIVVAADYANTQLKIYVNGSEVTAFNTSTGPTNTDGAVNTSGVAHAIGQFSNTFYLNGYLADVYLIDGQALTPTSFGEFDTNGVWQPKAYTGSYGTNGFRLTFSDNSGTTATTLGKDAAGSNNWTPNNFSVAAGSGNDSLVDVPTASGTDTGAGGEVRGNYATWNPLTVISTVGPGTLSNGNLDVSISGAKYTVTTILIRPDTGSYYWEVNSNGGFVAIYDLSNANTIAFSSYVQTQLNGLVGVALNSDTGAYTIYLNGSVSSSGTLSDPVFAWAPAVTGNGYAFTLNAGQRPFAYTAPSGFKALCTTNLPTPTIADGSTVMDVALYTGNGSTQTISGLGFSPDWVWIKRRNSTAWHFLFDTIRGTNKALFSNDTLYEVDYGSNYLDAFTSNGFTLGSNSDVNGTGGTFVAWTWDAGSSTVTNTQGSITSSCRTNQSSGFSIVGWTGNGAAASIGHGLNVEPHLVIHKFRGGSSNWAVYTKATGAGGRLKLNTTDAFSSDGTFPTTPTSSLFYVNAGSNDNGVAMIAYCFAPVAGYSAFGSYVGNGSADGPFVFTGFRARFLLYKRTDVANDWYIMDTARDTYNVSGTRLFPNLSNAEFTYTSTDLIDVTANGFKIRSSNNAINASGGTYIYAAFAEHPFQFSRAR